MTVKMTAMTARLEWIVCAVRLRVSRVARPALPCPQAIHPTIAEELVTFANWGALCPPTI